MFHIVTFVLGIVHIYQLHIEVETYICSSCELLQQVMGPKADHMSNLTMSSSSDSTTLLVPKLHDDGSNWADYQLRIERALGSKGLWRHVLGTAFMPKPYALLAGVPVIADEKTPAMEEQIELKKQKYRSLNERNTLLSTLYFLLHQLVSDPK